MDRFLSMPYSTSISDILKVRLGEYDVSTTAEPLRHEEINITEILIHPDFNNSTLLNDIALLKLEKPAKRKQVKPPQNSSNVIKPFFYIFNSAFRTLTLCACQSLETSNTKIRRSSVTSLDGDEELKVILKGTSKDVFKR